MLIELVPSRHLLDRVAAATATHDPHDHIGLLATARRELAGLREELADFVRPLTSTPAPDPAGVVTGFPPRWRLHVTAMLATALGGIRSTETGPLGGAVTLVETKAVLDHNLRWHTDSTSWEIPNRWQILTLLTPDRYGRPAPTGLLTWAAVIAALTPETAARLSTERYSWRTQFPMLTPLSAPVLGQANRWLIPALAEHRVAGKSLSDRALAELEAVILASSETSSVELAEDRILVFDNHRVLHRGPSLAPDGGRTLLRVKVGGHVRP
ncbi:TauD/TfdA family dioxygenase [Nocardia noduli]|uniref:TauD/TfdA family dioxygenase n=1 Tax=Nocardia noduli TaxID=2815722 RepID=UPI001C2242B2|nr:TauD/TfdA family dioxygenase [Nocardia noduli]